jgi:hypothetical protein
MQSNAEPIAVVTAFGVACGAGLVEVGFVLGLSVEAEDRVDVAVDHEDFHDGLLDCGAVRWEDAGVLFTY